jgi:uncharacterized protein YcbX
MKVSQVYVYPIKSLRGCTPPSHLATYSGFQHDRRFMLQRASDNKNMAVAGSTEMCLFTTHLSAQANNDAKEPSEFEVRYALSHAFDKPDEPVDSSSLSLSLDPPTDGLKEVKVNMHHSPTVGYELGSKYNDWFSARFGYDVRLLYIGDNKRLVLGNMSPNLTGVQRENGTKGQGISNDYEKIMASQKTDGVGGGGWLGSITGAVKSVMGGENKENEGSTKEYDGVDQGISFADVAPYLVISDKSWENVQKRLPEGEQLDISKFRPNIIISGAEEPFEEDFWGDLEITNPQTGKKAVLVLTQNCARCNSLNVDYGTGKVGEGEAGKVLKKLQTDRRVDKGAKWSPVFGRYAFLKKVDGDAGGVVLCSGDEVRVIRKNSERTRFGESSTTSETATLACADFLQNGQT